jgi:hypothetical protein
MKRSYRSTLGAVLMYLPGVALVFSVVLKLAVPAVRDQMAGR